MHFKFKNILTLALLVTCIHLGAMDTHKQEMLNQQLFDAVSNTKNLEGKVAMLLVQGANPNGKKFDPPLDKAISFENQEDTPLHIAIRNGHLSSALFLLEEKANVNAHNINGATPAHEAMWLSTKKALQMILLLSEYNVDLNIQDENGNTPLNLAIEQKKHELIKLLIQLGAKK